MSGPQLVVASVLLVDFGDGFENRVGDRAGQITYRRQPRARFECAVCGGVEGPVQGVEAVKRFVMTIRTSHVCRAESPPRAA